MSHNIILFSLLTFMPFLTLTAMPAQIVIIRHAEKPITGQDLSLKGKERAAALVPYFLNTPELAAYGPPIAIYAAGAPKDTVSRRSIETIQSLADALKIPVIDKFEADDYKTMASEIKTHPSYVGKTVLICWEHYVIPEIARSLGVFQTPARWPGEVFDRTWIITYQTTGKSMFYNLPQRLMFGDSFN